MSASGFFVQPLASPPYLAQAVPAGELNFWTSGLVGTQRQAVYADAALTVPLKNPVIADGNGQFPPIYLSPGVSYGVVFTTSATATAPAAPTQIWAVDPYSTSTPTAFVGDSGTGGVLGSVPAPPAGSGALNWGLNATGAWAPLQVSPSVSNLPTNQAGYLGAPIANGGVPLTANYQLQLLDLGKAAVSATASPLTITIPSDLTASWPLTMLSIILLVVPYGLGAWTIAPAAGVSLFSPPTFTASGNRTFTWGLAALQRYTTNAWMLTGTNIS